MLSLFLSSGIERGASIKGVVMSYEQSKGAWVAHVTNVSHKNIVCINITVNEHGGVGYSYAYYSPSESEQLDMHRWSDRFPPRGGRTFPPGETNDIGLGVDASESVTPVVDLVVYADDTAEVANEDAFKQYVLPIEEKILRSPGRMKKEEVGALMREILSEVNPKTGRTELEQLLRQLLRKAHQGSMKSAETVLERAFGKALAIQQNLNLNANMSNESEISLEEVQRQLAEKHRAMGMPPTLIGPRGREVDIEAIDARIEVLIKKLEEDKKPRPAPQLTEGTDRIQ